MTAEVSPEAPKPCSHSLQSTCHLHLLPQSTPPGVGAHSYTVFHPQPIKVHCEKWNQRMKQRESSLLQNIIYYHGFLSHPLGKEIKIRKMSSLEGRERSSGLDAGPRDDEQRAPDPTVSGWPGHSQQPER